jgi:DNA (cytosine-5)-methyltransferase 1
MRYLSVCSGIEAATVAWHDLGWQPVGFSEIEPFPSAVLAHHYPGAPNLGDMTNYKEWNIGAIDLVVGGTPCQSFSVAGLRKGLEDPRGNLALVYCGILDHFRPQWCVWENVPGVLSSNGGRDFGSFLGALAELGYGFAYRVLDAQYFGVAQRRRRVFVVGHLGDWQPAAKVLFESESLRRDTAPSRQKGQDTAASSVAGTLDSRHAGGFQSVQSAGAGHLRAVETPEVMCTLRATGAGFDRPGNAATEHETYIPMAQPISIQDVRPVEKAQNGKGWNDDGTAYTVDTHATQGVAQAIPLDTMNMTPGHSSGGLGFGQPGDPCFTLTKGHSHAVAQPIAPTLTASNDPSRSPQSTEVTNQVASVYAASMAVRRLTPIECERLQGFPDDYTAIPWRGKTETPDGPRYKALGNSMAVPVMQWIGGKINAE